MATRQVQSRRRHDTNPTSLAISMLFIIRLLSTTDCLTLRNLFLRRMCELDPDVLYTDVLKAFDNLTADELEVRFLSCI